MSGLLGAGVSGGSLTPTEAVLLLVLGAALVFLVISGGLSLAAIGLRMRAKRRARLRGEREVRWKTQLHRVLYDGAPEESLRELVDDRTALDFLNFLLQYARRLRGQERQVVCALAEPYLPRLQPFLTHESESRRARAVQVLGELGLPSHANTVLGALTDPSPTVAMVAASTLARAETPEYASEVLLRLDRFDHWRQDFLAAMVASMGEDAAPALRGILGDPSATTRVRSVAADALALLSDHAAADAAAEVLRAAENVELRAATLRVLASVGRDTHLDVVREQFAGPELPVRLAAIRALGRFGLEQDMEPLEHAAMHDPSPWVAIAAARAMKEGSGGAALKSLAGSDHPRAALGLQVISEESSW